MFKTYGFTVSWSSQVTPFDYTLANSFCGHQKREHFPRALRTLALQTLGNFVYEFFNGLGTQTRANASDPPALCHCHTLLFIHVMSQTGLDAPLSGKSAPAPRLRATEPTPPRRSPTVQWRSSKHAKPPNGETRGRLPFGSLIRHSITQSAKSPRMPKTHN